MKTKYILTLAVLLLAVPCTVFAQEDMDLPQQMDPKAREKVEATRIALISNRLGLTPDQAEKFWPVYREFAQKRGEVRSEFQRAQRSMNPKEVSPEKQQQLISLGLQLKQRELDLEKDYSGRILRVISAQQLINLRRAEQDFRQMILNQLQQRRALQQRKETFRENQQLKRNRD
ncbi:MAG: hypothetical protein SH819_09470 [Cytophagales bacterium]|nr:hypothetical protein [Cytophagales bacterium]